LDIDNKLRNYLKITGVLNNVFRPQKPLKETRIKLQNTLPPPPPPQFCYMVAKLGLLKQGTAEE
jgi:hypothetical protein